MIRFGALVFLLLCLNISGRQAQQCQEFKDGFKNYFQCILNCYRTHFDPGVFAGDLCTSEVTVEGLTPPEGGYTADQIELSLDCIAHQCLSEVPQSVCEDSSTPADSTLSASVSTSDSGSTASISSTDFTASGGSTGSSNSTASSGSTDSSGSTLSLVTDGPNDENQFDNEENCEDSAVAEAETGNNGSPDSATSVPTTSTDYSYEYYSDEDYTDESANSSSPAGDGKAAANADATSSNGVASASAAAQSQNNGNGLRQNSGNSQLQNNDKGGVDTNMQNSNNGNGYSYYSKTDQSLDAAGTDNGDRQITQQVPDSNMRNSNNGNGYSYYSKTAQQPLAASGAGSNDRQINQQVPNTNMQNSNYGNGYSYYSKPAQPLAAAGAGSNDRQINQQVPDTNMQNSNNGNGYSYYSKPAQPLAAAGTENSAKQLNQQVPVPNSQYQNFRNQRNNQNQYQRPAVQPIYNQPQVINQNSAPRPSAGGNDLSSRQISFSNNGNQAPPSNDAFSYSSGYANNRAASATAVGNTGGNSINGYNSGFRQNYGTGDNSGTRPASFAFSEAAANGGKAEANAGAFRSSSSSMSSARNFNPSSIGASPDNSGGPIRLNFGDDTLVIHGKQVQWHMNNQLVDSFALN